MMDWSLLTKGVEVVAVVLLLAAVYGLVAAVSSLTMASVSQSVAVRATIWGIVLSEGAILLLAALAFCGLMLFW